MHLNTFDLVDIEPSTLPQRLIEEVVWLHAAPSVQLFVTYGTGSCQPAATSEIVQETHQGMRYPNVTSLCFVTPLAFNAPDGGVPLGPSP